MRSNWQRAAVFLIVAALPCAADVASIRALIRAQRFGEAIAACDAELKTAPGNAALHTLKGLALQAAGDKPASLASFRRALALNQAYDPALQAAAQLEFEMRDPAALKRLEAVLARNPSAEPAHAMLGVLLFERRSCQAAVTHFEKAGHALESPAVKWPYGVCLLEAERWNDAASQFSALLALREHGPTRYNLALAQWNARDFQAAIATLAPLDRDTDGARLRASAYAEAGDPGKAVEMLQRAISGNPHEELLVVDLAVLCMDHNAVDTGIEVLQTAIESMPRSARLLTLLGVMRVRKGDVERGQDAFRRAQALEPASGLGRIGLASTLLQLGLAADAVRLLREQIAERGRDPRTELTLGKALLLGSPTAEDLKEAVVILERLVQQGDRSAQARGLLGKAYALSGQAEKAAAELAEAIRLDPSDRASVYQLMTIYRRMGRTKEAADLAARVRTLLDREAAEENSRNRFRVIREGQPE